MSRSMNARRRKVHPLVANGDSSHGAFCIWSSWARGTWLSISTAIRRSHDSTETPRTQYGIRGWRKAKIYPDFIFVVQGNGSAKRITVPETKGDQLDNLDTAYKRNMLTFLSDNFTWDDKSRQASWNF